MWAELEAVREFGTTPMWRLSIYGLDASEPQVSVSIPVPDHAALLRWQVSRDGVFDTSLPLDLWQTGALSGTVNPTGRGRLDILLQAKLDPKQVALGTVIELEATVGSWTDSWPVEYQVDPFTRDEKLWPKNDHRAVEEFLHVDKQGGELLADLVARGWTLADLLRSVIDVQDRILAAGIVAVQGPQGDQGDPGDPGADGVVDYDEAWDRANHTGTQSADTLTDGTTNKAFLATERTNLSSAVTKLGSVDNTGALFRIVNATGTGSIPLIVKGMASQTGDLQQWQNSAGTSVARIAQDGGAVFVGSLYTIAAQATSGTGAYLAINGTNISVINRTTVSAVPLIVKGMAAQTGNLQEWQNSAGTVLTRIMAGGSIDTGQVIYAPAIYDTSSTGPTLALGATSVTITNRTDVNNVPFVVKGMAGQVESLIQGRTSAGTPVFIVASNGSIYSAVSLATPVVESSSYNGSYLAVNGTSALVIGRTTVSNPVLVVRGMASQTGNLQEWQDSANAVKAYIAANGTLVTTGSVYTAFLSDTGATGPYIATGASSLQVLNRNTASNVPLVVKGMASQSGNLQQWQDSAGTALAWVSSTGGIATNGGLVATTLGSASSGYPYLSLGNNSITALNRTTASNVPLVVKGMASQTGNLQEWQNDSAAVLARVSANGTISASGSGVLTPYVQTSGGGGVFLGMDGSTVRVENATTASNVALTVKGMASQSGDLTQWKDSAGTTLAKITSAGNYYGPAVGDVTQTGPYISMGSASMTVFNRTTTSNVPLIVKGMAGQTGNLTQWQDSAGAAIALITSSGAFSGSGLYAGSLQSGIGTGGYLSLDGASVTVLNRTTASNVPLIVKGMAAQTGDLQQWQSSAGSYLAGMNANGALSVTGGYYGGGLNASAATGGYIALDGTSVSVINRTTASNVPLIVKGMASQSGDLQRWVDSADAVKAFVGSGGWLATKDAIFLGTIAGLGNNGSGPRLELANSSTVPTTNPTGGVVIYSESGVLKARDPNGVVTQLAPRPMELMVSVTDETTALTTGAAKLTFRIPRACAVTSVRANLNTVSSSGNPAFDVNKNGTSIFSTTLTIDASEKTSVTAATAAVLTSNPITFADDDEVTVDIDTAGTGAKGAKLTFLGYYT